MNNNVGLRLYFIHCPALFWNPHLQMCVRSITKGWDSEVDGRDQGKFSSGDQSLSNYLEKCRRRFEILSLFHLRFTMNLTYSPGNLNLLILQRVFFCKLKYLTLKQISFKVSLYNEPPACVEFARPWAKAIITGGYHQSYAWIIIVKKGTVFLAIVYYSRASLLSCPHVVHTDGSRCARVPRLEAGT